MESDDVKVIGDESASGDKKVNDDRVSFWDKWIWMSTSWDLMERQIG